MNKEPTTKKIKTPFTSLKEFFKEIKSRKIEFWNGSRKWKVRVYNHVIKIYNDENKDDPEVYRYTQHNVHTCEVKNLCGTDFLEIVVVLPKTVEDNKVEKIYFTDRYAIYETP
jgi:hypothetical protein